MSDPESRQFVKSFLRFLNKQIDEGRFSSESVESIEVATQCLSSVYELNDDAAAGGSALDSFDLFELYRNSLLVVSPERKEEAEELKNDGNRLMKEEKYQEALNAYNKAISLDATNPVYYCNRAAAFSRLSDYNRAAEDCKMSLKYDPKYSKAYGRLGLAYSKMNRFDEAVEAYNEAIKIEPENADYKNNLAVAQEKLAQNNAGPGSAFQNLDFAAALNNPALVSMASRMMTDPNIQGMLSQLSNLNDVNSLVETGRQLAQQISTQNPELMDTIRRQMQGGNEDDGPAPPPNN